MGDCLNHGLHGCGSRDGIGRDAGRVFVGNDRAREQDLYQDLLSPSLITQLITRYPLV